MTYPDPDIDPTGYVLAVADLREQRAKAATPGPWIPFYCGVEQGPDREGVLPGVSICDTGVRETAETWPNAEHIAAEANPDHALKEVALWRGIADRHRGRQLPTAPEGYRVCSTCDQGPPPARHVKSPCPDLLAAVAAAKAYAVTS